MNRLSRFALYLVAVIALPWLALGIAGAYVDREYCQGGDCNVLVFPILGVGVLVFVAVTVPYAVLESRFRRKSRR
jgi:hypothetical protein